MLPVSSELAPFLRDQIANLMRLDDPKLVAPNGAQQIGESICQTSSHAVRRAADVRLVVARLVVPAQRHGVGQGLQGGVQVARVPEVQEAARTGAVAGAPEIAHCALRLHGGACLPLHCEAHHEVECIPIFDAALRDSRCVAKQLACKNQSLLFCWNGGALLDLGLYLLNRVRRSNGQVKALTTEDLDRDGEGRALLSIPHNAVDEALDIAVAQGFVLILQLLPGIHQHLLVCRDAMRVLYLLFQLPNGVAAVYAHVVLAATQKLHAKSHLTWNLYQGDHLLGL
mmetsp:Transcript_36524/g.85578  ORF Transcript_36524/g.85578 Transcript_36524/m.85578 type:complete len:284 (+) Transcript_36524:826-1677(+)